MSKQSVLTNNTILTVPITQLIDETNTCGIGSTVHSVLAIDFKVFRHINRTLPEMLPVGTSSTAFSVLSRIVLVIYLRLEHARTASHMSPN